jgi:menaquinol-cytochrome c reductase iron-sulfur subunit
MTAPAGSLRPADENVSTSKETGMTRRVMLFKVGLLFNGLVAAALATPILRYVLAPVIGERKTGYDSWLSLGSLEQFPAGQTRLATFRNPVVTASDGETADIPCWVRNVDGQSFQVFAINCAHLGCPVRWFPQSNLFMCPCHGGAYYQDGSRASGPPERGLFEYSHKIEDGKLLIKAGEMPTPGRAANTAGGESRCV